MPYNTKSEVGRKKADSRSITVMLRNITAKSKRSKIHGIIGTILASNIFIIVREPKNATTATIPGVAVFLVKLIKLQARMGKKKDSAT